MRNKHSSRANLIPQSADFIFKFCKFVQHLAQPVLMKDQPCVPQVHEKLDGKLSNSSNGNYMVSRVRVSI